MSHSPRSKVQTIASINPQRATVSFRNSRRELLCRRACTVRPPRFDCRDPRVSDRMRAALPRPVVQHLFVTDQLGARAIRRALRESEYRTRSLVTTNPFGVGTGSSFSIGKPACAARSYRTFQVWTEIHGS